MGTRHDCGFSSLFSLCANWIVNSFFGSWRVSLSSRRHSCLHFCSRFDDESSTFVLVICCESLFITRETMGRERPFSPERKSLLDRKSRDLSTIFQEIIYPRTYRSAASRKRIILKRSVRLKQEVRTINLLLYTGMHVISFT